MASFPVFSPGNIKFLETDAFVGGFSKGQSDAVALEDALRKWRKDDQTFAQTEIANAQNNTLRGQSINANNLSMQNYQDTAATSGAIKNVNSETGKSVYQMLYNGAKARGFASPESFAAAMTNNMYFESGLNAGRINPNDKGLRSVGLMQWRGDRDQALQAYARSNGGDWRDAKTQIGFMFSELEGAQGRTNNIYSRLKSSTDPTTSMSTIFGFTRFEGYNDPNSKEYRKRMGALNGVVKVAGSGQWASSAESAPTVDPSGTTYTPTEAPVPPSRPVEITPAPTEEMGPPAPPVPEGSPYSRGLRRKLKQAQADNPIVPYSDPMGAPNQTFDYRVPADIPEDTPPSTPFEAVNPVDNWTFAPVP